ncbi:hypothetical protein CCHOA_03850 [Corynebacterium choanae]|uniref:DUF4245 domain-containing protein n=2 Tax=Corynebacterium choanae TaxID=1862358 RepID=A0A3G6J5H0_9CORY|nr:hypothetical protein CCHOA_03850 [Corynebacterium choanae]
MLLSLGVCFVVILLAISFTGLCSFNPGTPESGPVREVDAETIFDLEARAMPFPVILPETPKGWVANAARRTNVHRHPAPIVGWVTKDMAYLQLLQTDQPADVTVDDFDEIPREHTDTVDIAGHTWKKLEPTHDRGKDTLWITDAGQVRWLVTGTAGDAEFRELATNIAAATPLRAPADPLPENPDQQAPAVEQQAAG